MSTTQIPTTDLVFFGGTGDLAVRKLFPALYFMFRDAGAKFSGKIIGAARQTLTDEQYRALLAEKVPQHIPKALFDQATLNALLACVEYVQVDATQTAGFTALAKSLQQSVAQQRPRVFYLATAPSLFVGICHQLKTAGLVDEAARVVLEKPLGRDLKSSQVINDAVGEIFEEQQIYRIDHYLGKEAVQNLLALRFGNTIFEPLWSREWIDSVQITIAEQVGLEGRGEFYDNTGALRDMVQNHLLQLLCMVAMEPPPSTQADAVRDAKLGVLRSLKPIVSDDIRHKTVYGQYREGAVGGNPVPGYLQEQGITSTSRTETFVAIKAELGNWRWAGVPFYLRTGKRMQERLAEVVINFKPVPHSIFQGEGSSGGNQLVIRLQPDDGLKLLLQAKMPGDSMRLEPFMLNLHFNDYSKGRRLDAYERLLMDVMRGNLALFMRRDEQEAAWRWVEPIMAGWQNSMDPPKPYTAGTWGPAASSALIGRDGRTWNEESQR